jgi:hypothetical protein
MHKFRYTDIEGKEEIRKRGREEVRMKRRGGRQEE